jgi:hypothetical protein
MLYEDKFRLFGFLKKKPFQHFLKKSVGKKDKFIE